MIIVELNGGIMERAIQAVGHVIRAPRVGTAGARGSSEFKVIILSSVCVWEGVIDWKPARGCLWGERSSGKGLSDCR